MRWFGPNWGAPVCQEHAEVPLPAIGERCGYCDLEFVDGDRGLVLDYFGDDGREDFPVHHACLMATIFGRQV